jgi:hypothetical protein
MMTNWQKRTDRDGVDYEVLALPDGIHEIEAAPLGDSGRFWASRGGNGIGQADTMEGAKQLAERWALAQIAEMLKSLGAEGIWLIRGAKEAHLKYYRLPIDPAESNTFWVRLERPMERILLIRLPAGDGGEDGIEYF